MTFLIGILEFMERSLSLGKLFLLGLPDLQGKLFRYFYMYIQKLVVVELLLYEDGAVFFFDE